MKNSERSSNKVKAKYPRLKRLLCKRKANQDWYAISDKEGNVTIVPIN